MSQTLPALLIQEEKMKSWIKKKIISIIKPCILFESSPDFSDNSRAVYDEMVRRGYDKKYDLIWFVDWDKCATIKKDGSIDYWDPSDNKTLGKRIRCYAFYHKCRAIICCSRFIPSRGYVKGNHIRSFYLSHGTPMKSVKQYYTSPGRVNYILSPSEAMNSVMAYEFSFKPEQVFAAGFPRNDVFARPPVDLKSILGTECSKIIAWYPTYRQHFSNGIVTSSISIPIVHDEQAAFRLNEIAAENGVLLLLKPHPAQDVSLLQKLDLSNIWMINDRFLTQKGLLSYEMLRGTDALITDYSSVYFDYTLCDKPIGVVWEDIDEYRQFPGFALDLDKYLKGAEKIYTVEDFGRFIKEVADGTDTLREERREIRDLTNISTDGQNTSRVVDFIAETAAL